MFSLNDTHKSGLASPVRKVFAKVEFYKDSTLEYTYTYNDNLVSYTVERVGDSSKFYGFGVCQKLNVKLLDVNNEINITTAHSIKAKLAITTPSDWNCVTIAPEFYVSEVHRDENTNALSITAYDALYKASQHTIGEIALESYTIKELAKACAVLIGLKSANLENIPDTDLVFDTYYDGGANLEGSETVREVLDAIAEATQTVYYASSWNTYQLRFKRLDVSGDAVLTIGKDDYYTLNSKTNRRLVAVAHTTQLGDNVTAALEESGTTQYIRDNPFYELRDDIDTLLDNALIAVGGLTINQFDCKWRGNHGLEVGDKIALITKDDETVYSYMLDDVITYNGGLSQQTKWSYAANDIENTSNPSSLGDTLKQTRARVDKLNKEIEIVASETAANSDEISSILINTESITASVQKISETTTESFNTVNGEIATLTSKVNAAITAEDVQLTIESELSNGVDKVITNTGFTFDDEGLTVSKSDSEMKTQITEDGMIVYKNDQAVLTANNIGVDAVNLHATTYLIIGTNSRFEDYGDNRTGCFWIGESE